MKNNLTVYADHEFALHDNPECQGYVVHHLYSERQNKGFQLTTCCRKQTQEDGLRRRFNECGVWGPIFALMMKQETGRWTMTSGNGTCVTLVMDRRA